MLALVLLDIHCVENQFVSCTIVVKLKNIKHNLIRS